MRGNVIASSAAVPPRPRRPPNRTSPDDVKPLSSPAPIAQEKEPLDTRSRRHALLSAAFSALATGLSSDRAAALAATSTSTSTPTPPPPPPLSPPAPPAGWSYARKGKDWPSLGFDSCGLVGKQSPINISPPFTRIRRRGRRRREQEQLEQEQQQQQQPFLELAADYRSAAFDVVVERGVTSSPKFTVVAAGGKGERRGGGGGGARGQPRQEQQRHPAGGVYLLGGGGGGEEGGCESGELKEEVFYPLVQFHFHRPGEESLEGRRGALGLHLVHQRDGEEEEEERESSSPVLPLPRFVVVAVAFDLSRGGGGGGGAPAAAALDELFPGGGGDGEDGEDGNGPPWRRIEAFDPSRLLPTGTLSKEEEADAPPSSRGKLLLENFFAYDGSLTTPPCTASARFYFAKSRGAASSGQVSRAVTPRGAQNARPLQERGGRAVWEG